MDTVTISPEYHVILPRSVRERFQLQPGQKVQVLLLGDRIELMPIRAAPHLRGFVRGMDARVDRDAR